MTDVKLEGESRTIQATSLDLSPTGISVWADDGEAPRGRITMTFALDEKLVTVGGRLARSYQSDGGAVWGIEFENLDEGTKAVLESFLDRNG